MQGWNSQVIHTQHEPLPEQPNVRRRKHRGDVWVRVSGAQKMLETNNGKYQQLLIKCERDPPAMARVIECDLDRTFPNHESLVPCLLCFLLYCCYLLPLVGLLRDKCLSESKSSCLSGDAA